MNFSVYMVAIGIIFQDHKLKVESVSVGVYERAVRNCPWCVQLWQNYILLFERMGQSYEKIKGRV